MKLDLWNESEIETYTTGDAISLRETYFGELVLTATRVAEQHRKSVASIRHRWLPGAHYVGKTERELRQMLGENAAWAGLEDISNRLDEFQKNNAQSQEMVISKFATQNLTVICDHAKTIAQMLRGVYGAINSGDIDVLVQNLSGLLPEIPIAVIRAPGKLRAEKLIVGFYATNIVADMQDAIRLVADIRNSVTCRIVAVVAGAGCGKTHLSAQLTSDSPKRPAGILLHGRYLNKGGSLSDIASQVTINGRPVSSIDSLLFALNTLGQRHRCRLPLVIDGLNEADDPRDWMPILAELEYVLQKFSHVLTVLTIRPGVPVGERGLLHGRFQAEMIEQISFVDQALPQSIKQLIIPDMEDDIDAAMAAYFKYFRIKFGDNDMPVEMISSPLMLRMYCEVMNPDCSKDVDAGAMPGSLAIMFEDYLRNAVNNIESRSSDNCRYTGFVIRRAISALASELWRSSCRMISEADFRVIIGDENRPLHESIVFMLEQEGIITRAPGSRSGQPVLLPVFDLLGGHIIASYLIGSSGLPDFERLVNCHETIDCLNGNRDSRHPLAQDILVALVGLVPRRFAGHQLWKVVKDPLRGPALIYTASLSSSDLDADTVEELGNCIRSESDSINYIFRHIYSRRGAVGHPLNGQFLDSVLRAMSVESRDLVWSEWIRTHREHIEVSVARLERRWMNTVKMRSPEDCLRARWNMWLLTTTVRRLRNRVTRLMYWFGRSDPSALFDLTVSASNINDPYVFERLLAASYGVAMDLHCQGNNSLFRAITLPFQANKIFGLLFAPAGPCRTTHALIREYGRRFIELAVYHNARLFDAVDLKLCAHPFPSGGRIEWPIESDPQKGATWSGRGPMRMDFENYMLGALVADRGNYDYVNLDYRQVRAMAMWRIGQLGWSESRFGVIDGAIGELNYGRKTRDEERIGKIDRYGKKYSWIAYFELSGYCSDRGISRTDDDDEAECDARCLDVDIDPSFPACTASQRIFNRNLLGSKSQDTVNWIEWADAPVLIDDLVIENVFEQPGLWVMLSGRVAQQSEDLGRQIHFSIRPLLVDRSEAAVIAGRLISLTKRDSCYSSIRQVFAGEIPWCSVFGPGNAEVLEFKIGENEVRVCRTIKVWHLGSVPICSAVSELSFGYSLKLPADASCGGVLLSAADRKRARLKLIEREYVEVQPVMVKHSVFSPICFVDATGKDDDGSASGGITLEKGLALEGNLVHCPGTYDLQTADGGRATLGVKFDGGDYYNSEQCFFVARSVLQSLLGGRGKELIWLVSGRRELSNRVVERAQRGDSQIILARAEFVSVLRFSAK